LNININKNFFLGTVFINRLSVLGVKDALVSPGSRNTPLVCALAEKKEIRKTIILDERSSGFFALGVAKATNSPVLIVTTSGTAVAELYPAIIEAYQSRVPLIICTADRPAELHNCGANQTINQENIFGNHIRNYYNFSNFDESESSVEELIAKTTEAFFIASKFDIGPVHINFPFAKPLEPDTYTTTIDKDYYNRILHKLHIINYPEKKEYDIVTAKITSMLEKLKEKRKGIIIVGPGNYSNEFYNNCYALAQKLNFPIFADGLSSFRFTHNDYENLLLNNYPIFISNFVDDDSFGFDIIIQFGRTPTSKYLLQFFEKSNAYKILVNEHGELFDPSKTSDLILHIPEESFISQVVDYLELVELNSNKQWLNRLKEVNTFIEDLKYNFFNTVDFPFEGKIILEILNSLPIASNVIFANSMPPRDIDYYAGQLNKNFIIYSNRGASGIDGNTATAAGIAYSSNKNSVLITGDLSFLHDIGSLTYLKLNNIPLTIILINNNGGGIFNMLPIANNSKVFEPYFLTPHNLILGDIVAGFGGEHIIINNWDDLYEQLKNQHSQSNFKVLEIFTNSTSSALIRNTYKTKIINELKKHFS